jgi:hypothetical protein
MMCLPALGPLAAGRLLTRAAFFRDAAPVLSETHLLLSKNYEKNIQFLSIYVLALP